MLGNGFYNMDCMDGMRQFPDGYFDLAIVDPPYGNACAVGGGGNWKRFGGWFDRYAKADVSNGRNVGGKIRKKIAAWDAAPGEEYFKELFRVSRNQIIWGGNYFRLPPTRCFVVWNKCIGENFSMAMCEYAWTSFWGNAKIFKCAPQGTKKDPRFHPTQKPIKLYEWLLSRYAKPGDKILDTHVGSASSLIACERGGFEYVGFEIDGDYYAMANARLETERENLRLQTKSLVSQ